MPFPEELRRQSTDKNAWLNSAICNLRDTATSIVGNIPLPTEPTDRELILHILAQQIPTIFPYRNRRKIDNDGQQIDKAVSLVPKEHRELLRFMLELTDENRPQRRLLRSQHARLATAILLAPHWVNEGIVYEATETQPDIIPTDREEVNNQLRRLRALTAETTKYHVIRVGRTPVSLDPDDQHIWKVSKQSTIDLFAAKFAFVYKDDLSDPYFLSRIVSNEVLTLNHNPEIQCEFEHIMSAVTFGRTDYKDAYFFVSGIHRVILFLLYRLEPIVYERLRPFFGRYLGYDVSREIDLYTLTRRERKSFTNNLHSKVEGLRAILNNCKFTNLTIPPVRSWEHLRLTLR